MFELRVIIGSLFGFVPGLFQGSRRVRDGFFDGFRIVEDMGERRGFQTLMHVL